jgi:hypothetical protein
MVNPSGIVAGVWPVEKVTTEHWLPGFLAQKLASVHGLPVELMVVTAAPPWEMTLTSGFIRNASRQVPGATLTRSPLAATQMASWMRQ